MDYMSTLILSNMATLGELVDQFWSEDIWLPRNVTWADIKSSKISHDSHESFSCDIVYLSLPVAIIMVILQSLLQRFWFQPVGLSLGFKKASAKKARPNTVLENAYYVGNRKIHHKQIVGLAKQLDWSERQVERWLRHRKCQETPTTLARFCNASWRFLCYTGFFCFGVFCLWDKSWFWNIHECFEDYPHHAVADDCWWYYFASLSFWLSLTFRQFMCPTYKYFWQILFHNLVTICLICFSWICNFHRIGVIVLVLHSSSDFLLEASKLAKFCQYQKISSVLFLTFAVTWVVARCIYYPFQIIHSTYFLASEMITSYPGYYVFNGLLQLLMCLHLFWTYVIFKAAPTVFFGGKTEHLSLHKHSPSSDDMYDPSNSPHTTPKRHKPKVHEK